MGLKLRYNLFHGVDADAAYEALRSFWADHGHRFLVDTPSSPVERSSNQYLLYQRRSGWTLLDWDRGWEWTLRRQAQLHVSRTLGCAGLLFFIVDGDYWGYELFRDGRVLDQFVQRTDVEATWFPDRDCRGRPELFAAEFPAVGLDPAEVASYLARQPEWEEGAHDEAWAAWNVPARSGDEYRRGDECAGVDFLRMLGVGIEFRRYDGLGEVGTPLARLRRGFVIDPPIGDQRVLRRGAGSSPARCVA